MDLIITEKPSVARDIAKVLKVTTRKDGYLTDGKTTITWAFGHLVNLVEPEVYDPRWKKWSLEMLPIIPDQFRLAPIGDDGASKQLAIIKNLCEQADLIVCATDAGREGELIFRYILSYLRIKANNIMRLWISSMTDQAIKKGFEQLRKGQEFDLLYDSARARSEADWLVGMNGSRLFTLLYALNNELFSIGRVQTPVLAMVVDRYFEIIGFTPETYFTLTTIYRNTTFTCEQEKIPSEEEAATLLDRVKDRPLLIQSVERKNQNFDPPLLFDLTTLQRVMNNKRAFSADKTLKIAQSLYEGKAITYPRTDSNYLSEDMFGKIASLIADLGQVRRQFVEALLSSELAHPRRVFDDSKVSDHHAIIPTGIKPEHLSDDEREVFLTIVDRFLAAFYPPCVKALTIVRAEANGVCFKTSGSEVLTEGWKAVLPEEKKSKEDPDNLLPSFIEGEQGEHRPKIDKAMTKPPRYHSESSLLAAMETAGKTCETEETRQAMKDKGLGTPATRAAIIELLINRQYIKRNAKRILPSEKGIRLITVVGDHPLHSAEMTGEWEFKLKRIERGDYPIGDFLDEIRRFTKEMIALKTKSAMVFVEHGYGLCPICQAPVIKGKRDYGCSGYKQGCTFVLPAEKDGVRFNHRHVRELLQFGRVLTPLASENDGELVYPELRHGVLKMLFLKEKVTKTKKPHGRCPSCHGEIVETARGWSCAFKGRGCAFFLGKIIAGKHIDEKILAILTEAGRSEKIDGFTSKKGTTFSARLMVEEDGSVGFRFD